MSTSLRFGIARDCITPDAPQTMMGFASVFGNPFTDIHDDLFVRVLALKHGTDTLLFVTFDLCFHDESLPEAIRAYAAKKHGVRSECVHVGYTHTHYGPAVRGYDFTFHTDSYEQFILARACAAVDRAFLTLCEGHMSHTRIAGDWNISRRKMVDGQAEFLPSLAGARDPHLYVLRLTDLSGRVRALAVSFACHPSNLGHYRTLSSEYPGRLCALLEAANYGCGAIFMQGFAGDTKLKIGAKGARFSGISYEDLNETAAGMATRVQEALHGGTWTPVTPHLGGQRFVIPVPLSVYPRAFFEEELASYGGGEGTLFDKSMINPTEYSGSLMMRACAEHILTHYDELPDTLPLSCGVLRLADDLFVCTMGGEPSCDVGRVLKSLLPEGQMITLGYTDAIAYIPSDSMLVEGGYEAGGRSVTEYRLKGACAPGIDRLFLTHFAAALHTLGVPLKEGGA